MSFGFSVSDSILLIDAARTQYNNCVAAGAEYHDLARDVKTLHSVLELLHHESLKASSPLLGGDLAFATHLAPAINGCERILEDLQTLLAKYESLSSNKPVNPTRKLWDKIRFGSKIQELREVRRKIILYTTTIAVLLDTMQLRATGRLEDKLDATSTAMMDGFQSIKLAMVEEALKAKSASPCQSTVSLLSMSTYNEDDKEVWQEFRRQLISKGFKSNQLDKHSDMLQAYLLKLVQSDVLDEMGMHESTPKHKIFPALTDISEDLAPTEEENHLTKAPPIRQDLNINASAFQQAGFGSTPPRDHEEEMPPTSASVEHGTSTFPHANISHAVSQGPEALPQALDPHPQLRKDPCLDVAISSGPLLRDHDGLQAMVAAARQETPVAPEESRSNPETTPQPVSKFSAKSIKPLIDIATLFTSSKKSSIVSRMGVKLLALCVRKYRDTIEERQEDDKSWRAYLSSLCSTSRAEELFGEVAKMKADLAPTAAALDKINLNCVHEGWSKIKVLESRKAAIIPILDQGFFKLCENLGRAERYSGIDIAKFWTIEIEEFRGIRRLIDCQYIALSQGHRAKARMTKSWSSAAVLGATMTEDFAISMSQGSYMESREERLMVVGCFPAHLLTCSQCAKPHIEFNIHYNCDKCFNGSWNICLECYRARKGCLNWFGFGSAAWAKWERLKSSGYLSAGAEQPHTLIASRFADLASTSSTPLLRLETGMFCSNCLKCANDCYFQCDLCNYGDWGFCYDCVNQGRCCTHPLIPWAYTSYELEASPTSGPRTRLSPSALAGQGAVSRDSFEPLTWTVSCDICLGSIQTFAPRFHCSSCASSSDDCDICYSCYSELERKGRIAPENGQTGWRRCLHGHRMIIIRFEDTPHGQRRIILNDLVGGRMLRRKPFKSEPGFDLRRWSWSNETKSRPVDRDVRLSAPMHRGDTTDFPPDGGVGKRAKALWSWFSKESDELMFPAEAEVTEILNVNGDWSFGVYMGMSGLFPTSYVK